MGRAGIRYQPALDGLRAFAVTAVILYHLAYTWAGGGFLGVDAFFVLSGFLITTLLLAEREPAGPGQPDGVLGPPGPAPAPGALPAARRRRALRQHDDDRAPARQLRGDAIASLFYVANWHFIATNQSYFALFTQPSPLQHLWSLAIEEQFYLLWPLIVVGVLAARAGDRGARSTIVTVAGIVDLADLHGVAVLRRANPSRAYYGTEARAHTLLVGCLLALML